RQSQLCWTISVLVFWFIESMTQPPKAAASGFPNLKPEPWATGSCFHGLCRPGFFRLRNGRLTALSRAVHITSHTPNETGVQNAPIQTPHFLVG
ncbi:hypothetical protein B0F90DRAFT_1771310, partial [Multifurca ochricompacta]